MAQNSTNLFSAASCEFVDRSSPNGKQARDRVRMLGLVLAAFLLIVSGVCASGLQRRVGPKTSHTEDVFRRNCARCHGPDGRGDTPLGQTFKTPDFTDPEWWQKHSDITGTKSLVTIVSAGKASMPAFGKKLTRAEINQLVGYVRRFKKPSR